MARYSTKKKPTQSQRNSLLPLFLALAGLALVVFTGFALWNNSKSSGAGVEVKGAARIKVEPAVIEHGDVTLGTPIRDEIRVTNAGDQPLRFVEAPYVELREGC